MLTVIIPTNELERVLVRTLSCLVSGAASGLVSDVILADAGSRDETEKVGEVAGCRFMALPGAHGERLRAAAAAGKSGWLLFIRPGIVLDPGWEQAVERFIGGIVREGSERAGTFRLAPDGTNPLRQAIALLGASLSRARRPDQGLLLARSFYDRLGGHRGGDGAETDLLRRIGRGRIAMLPCGARRN